MQRRHNNTNLTDSIAFRTKRIHGHHHIQRISWDRETVSSLPCSYVIQVLINVPHPDLYCTTSVCASDNPATSELAPVSQLALLVLHEYYQHSREA